LSGIIFNGERLFIGDDVEYTLINVEKLQFEASSISFFKTIA
jgi:hypothetical protein